jgi:hypothetical protein
MLPFLKTCNYKMCLSLQLEIGCLGSGSVFMSFGHDQKSMYVPTCCSSTYIYYWSFSRHSSRNRVCWSVQMFLVFTCTKFRVKLVWSLDAAKCHTWVISTLSIAHNTFCLGFCTQIHSICLWEASQYMSWSLTTDKESSLSYCGSASSGDFL